MRILETEYEKLIRYARAYKKYEETITRLPNKKTTWYDWDAGKELDEAYQAFSGETKKRLEEK